jgi:hypothetical protein
MKRATKEAPTMAQYLLTMELYINAYAIVEAISEEEAKKKGVDLKFDCMRENGKKRLLSLAQVKKPCRW